jgi:hypothetical protein
MMASRIAFIGTLFFRLMDMCAFGATVRMLKHEQFRLMAIIAVMQRKTQPVAEKHKEHQCAEQGERLQYTGRRLFHVAKIIQK